MQCHKNIKPQFLNWGFFIAFLLLSVSCSKKEEQQYEGPDHTNKEATEALIQLKELFSNYALEKGYLLSWEKRNHNPVSENPNLLQIETACDFTQTNAELLECFTLATLEALPDKSLRYDICISIADAKDDIGLRRTFCQAIYAPTPILEDSTTKQKAIAFLSNNDPMQLASFKWTSSEWITFMAYLNGKLSQEQLSILNNYFRFTETTDPHLLSAYSNLRTRD